MKRLYLLTLYIAILSLPIYTMAQCAMCKAGAEQSLEKGATDAAWINYGILFLMAIPFLLIACIYWMYRQNNR